MNVTNMTGLKLILLFYSIQYLSVQNVQASKHTTRRSTTVTPTTSTSTTPTTPATSMTPTTPPMPPMPPNTPTYSTPLTASNTAIQMTVFSPTVDKSPCYCLCLVPQLNLTAEEFKESLKDITIDKKNTSKYIRSKISAPDERTSSKAIGMVAIVFIVLPFGLLILSDIPTLVCQIMTTFKQIR